MNKEPQHCSLRHSVGYKLMFQAPRWQHVKITSLKSSEWTEQKNPSEDTRQKPGWDRVLFFVIQWKPTFLKNKSPPVQRILENLSASTRFGTVPTWGRDFHDHLRAECHTVQERWVLLPYSRKIRPGFWMWLTGYLINVLMLMLTICQSVHSSLFGVYL